MHETATAEEEGAEFGVLAFFAVGCVEEPDGGIDAYAEAAEGRGGGGGWGAVEAVVESEMGEGTGLGCWTEDLSVVVSV